MYQPKTEKDIRCPLEYALDLFGKKWKSRIVCLLGLNGTIRYGELKRELENVTDTVLAATLKEMIKENIVQRIQYDEIPPRVEYSLTKEGMEVVPAMVNLCMWAERKRGNTENTCIGAKTCYYKRKELSEEMVNMERV